MPPPWVTELRRDPYAVFRGPHRHTAFSTTAAGALLLGMALAAVPGSAVAQTVRPTTPGASAFTAARLAAAPVPEPVVQVAAPSPYRMPGGAAASRAAVAVAANLAATGAADTPGAPAPAPTAQATPPAAPAPPPGPVWSAPAPGAPVTNPFGVPDREYAAGYHTGVDFAVDSGTPLLAVGDATVVSAGWDGAYGNEVVLRLSDGRFAQYAHLSELGVRAGDQVTGGQRIGASGSTGNSTGPHLHFEIRTANRYGAVIDPIAYLSGHGAGNF
ncbi:M23 family metallopeptidase [Kitasatospora acidiphila]|uniref:M23 family metallopeptidase n=1 Tax=Kitasatospora acidiphila TaxID=2567942 RepID=UPI003C7247D0